MSDEYRSNMPPIMEMPTHADGMKDCAVATSTAVHSVTLSTGRAYAVLVHYQRDFPVGYCSLLDREEGEAMIELLRCAMDDADRINQGKTPLARPYNPDAKLN
jgi:hypothetical protein